jgi:hypothetical protein
VGARYSIIGFFYFFLQQVFLFRHLGWDLRPNLTRRAFNLDLIQFSCTMGNHLLSTLFSENGISIDTLHPHPGALYTIGETRW